MHSRSAARTAATLCWLTLPLFLHLAAAQPAPPGRQTFTVLNEYLSVTAVVEKGRFVSEIIEPTTLGQTILGTGPAKIESDGGFSVDLVWNDWRIPGRNNNADVTITLARDEFTVLGAEDRTLEDGTRRLTLLMQADRHPFDLRLVYDCPVGRPFIRRSIAIRDTASGDHFLHAFSPRNGIVAGTTAIIKPGDFGQPVALRLGAIGAFLGLEYPAAQNHAENSKGGVKITCSQEMGVIVGRDWVRSDPVVFGLAPPDRIKLWFFRYLDAVRVAPVAPYTLYNSWYDLRSAEYPRVPARHVMNEENVLRIIGLLRKNMVDAHGISLDAVVLDDGWDVYQSDWQLRDAQFPRGLAPIAAAAREMNSGLGIWYGPIGGYSFRRERVEWMKGAGYEVAGGQLCIGGTKYRELLRKRVTDMVEKDGVVYFKWDGIQFSCSRPDHGHPVGVYSRRAIMESVIDLCKAVREKNGSVYLNITSGTWLSPWWLKYANQVWMDGADHDWADVPSISRRDAAITYRDLVLYDDFHRKDLWMPMANLMTHGIIKGELERLGSEEEPLDKFTDDVMMYFARGVSMWELYVSPDILSAGEWESLSGSIRWAKDRSPFMKETFMIGGDPAKGEPYGYVHAGGTRAILAARNPGAKSATLKCDLSLGYGFTPEAGSMVIEQVYPVRRVFPSLVKAGSAVSLSLAGYETAVYELTVPAQSPYPLVTNGVFEIGRTDGGSPELTFYPDQAGTPQILNASAFPAAAARLSSGKPSPTKRATVTTVPANRTTPGDSGEVRFTLDGDLQEAEFGLLLTPLSGSSPKEPPAVTIVLDGEERHARIEAREGRWAWFLVPLAAGPHTVSYSVAPPRDEPSWRGSAEAWVGITEQRAGISIPFEYRGKRTEPPMPPRTIGPGRVRSTVFIGTTKIVAGAR